MIKKIRTWLYINSYGLTQLAQLTLWLLRPLLEFVFKEELKKEREN